MSYFEKFLKMEEPFGMPMPGQTWESSTSDCQNVTQTALMPIHNYVEITSLNSDFLSILGASLTTAPLAFKVTATPPNQGFSYNIAPVVPNLAQQIKIYFHAPTPFILNYNVAQSGCSLPMNTIPPGTKTYTIYFTPCNLNAIQLLITAPSVFATTTIVIDSIVKDSISFTPELVITKVCDEGVYEYGYNGQRKDNEWAGNGNHNTALYWEYDPRIAQRGNLDPKGNVWESPYAVFGNNPIRNVDVLGDVVKTNKEGGDVNIQGVNRILEGKKNPLGFDEKNGVLTYDNSVDVSQYNKTAQTILDRYKQIIDKDDIVNFFVINRNDLIDELKEEKEGPKTLHDRGANGVTIPQLLSTDYGITWKFTTQNVYVARDPARIKDEKLVPEQPEYIGIAAMHELAGHAYLNYDDQNNFPKGDVAKAAIQNSKVEELETQIYKYFKINPKDLPWYKGRTAPKHP